ncbi:MAG: N-acetylmuramoyl-L-alanine amidase [Rikenellaceae bacterium]
MKRVILDAGHGIDTAGKRSPTWADGSQLLEWEFNRDIVSRIAHSLNSLGINYNIITPEREDIPLPERVRRANAIHAEDRSSYLLSIHANAGGGTGWEAFTSVGESLSDTYAEILYDKARAHLRDFPIRSCYTDGDSDKESGFYILRKSTCAAILTENLFMDTERDCRFIMSNTGRETIAQIHTEAILSINSLV